MSDELSKSQAARWWLSQGFELLPIYPNSKKLVIGHGQHLKHVTRDDEVLSWWPDCESDSNYNLAVIATGRRFVIDFDDWGLYCQWLKEVPEEIGTTYTELTPNMGAHVFAIANDDIPAGLRLRRGAELLRVAVVAPSMIGDRAYERGFGEVLQVDIDRALFPLSEPGHKTAYRLRVDAASIRRDYFNPDLWKIIKNLSCLEVLKQYAPSQYKTLTGQGRYLSARCPFHKGGIENHPSFWIDRELNIWGCHACPAHGDAINLYAELNGYSNSEAIRRLSFGAE